MNKLILWAPLLACVAIPAIGNADNIQSPGPTTVYAMDNAPTGNHVFAWRVNGNGVLMPIGQFATGGLGTGTSVAAVDPLGSEGSLTLGSNNKTLFAVNAGDGTLTAFKVDANGSLVRTDVVSSDGTNPVSVTSHGNLVYVANVNAANATSPSTIVGFQLSKDGTLSEISGSSHQLSDATARPSQVSITPDGTQVIITERVTNKVDAFNINANGTLGNPQTTASPRPGPFGFGFSHGAFLVASEAGNPSSASSYQLESGAPEVISGGVINGQIASCWTTVSLDGWQAFVSDAGTNAITNYRIGADGSLTIQQQAVPTDGAGSAPIDSGASSRFFVQLLGAKGSIAVYAISGNGDLSLLRVNATGLPVQGAQGLAVRP